MRTIGFFRLRAIASEVTTSAPPPSVTTQQSRRCSGSEIIGEFSTSSTVTTSRSIACFVVLGVVGCRDLDPGQLLAGGAEELMHVAHGAHAVDIVRGRAIGGLESASAPLARGGIGPVRGLPASVISAIEHFPAAIASAAWPRWTR